MADVIEFIRQLNKERLPENAYGIEQTDSGWIVSLGGNKSVYSDSAFEITATSAQSDKFDRFDFESGGFMPWEEFFNVVLKDFYDGNRFLSYGTANEENILPREHVAECLDKVGNTVLPQITYKRETSGNGSASRCLYEMAVKFRYRSKEGADGYFINKFYFSDINGDGIPTLLSPDKSRRYYKLVTELTSGGQTRSDGGEGLGLSLEALDNMLGQVYEKEGDLSAYLVGSGEGDAREAWLRYNEDFIREYAKHSEDGGENPIKPENYSLRLTKPVVRYIARLWLPIRSYPFMFCCGDRKALCDVEADTVSGAVSLRCPVCGEMIFSVDKRGNAEYGHDALGQTRILVYDEARKKFVCSDCAPHRCSDCGHSWSDTDGYDGQTLTDSEKGVSYCAEHTVVCSVCGDKHHRDDCSAGEYDKCDSCGRYVCKKCQMDNRLNAAFITVHCDSWTDDCGNRHDKCSRNLCSACKSDKLKTCVSCGETLCTDCKYSHVESIFGKDEKQRYYHNDTDCCEICYHTYTLVPKLKGKEAEEIISSRQCKICGEVFTSDDGADFCPVCKPLYDIDLGDPSSGKQYADYYKKYYRGAVLSASPYKFANANNGVAVLRVKDKYYKICKYDGRERNIKVRPLNFIGGK